MRVRDALIGSLLPAADAEVLLAHAVGHDRAWLLAHPDDALSDEQRLQWSVFLERRRRLEPVAYITGKREFFGREFAVDDRVLIPRPSTEHLVQGALQFLADGVESTVDADSGVIVAARRVGGWRAPALIADVGTGSGCIAVTLALERLDLRLIASDISAGALEVAQENARRHGVADRIAFEQGDGAEHLADIHEPFLLVMNPPYIPRTATLMKDVIEYEPHIALFGGDQGTDVLHRVIDAMKKHEWCVGFVVECEEGQLL